MVLGRIAEWHYFVWAARILNATKICVPVALDELNIESLQCNYVRVLAVIGMPSGWVPIFVRMDEGDCGGEIIIVLDNVGEVRICFHPFVPQCTKCAISDRV